jgi:hypothetical protein
MFNKDYMQQQGLCATVWGYMQWYGLRATDVVIVSHSGDIYKTT